MSNLRKNITNTISKFADEYEFEDTLKVLQTNIKGLIGVKMKLHTLTFLTNINIEERLWGGTPFLKPGQGPHPEFLRDMQRDLIVSMLEFCAMPDLYERISKEVCFYKRYRDFSEDLKNRKYRKLMKAQLFRTAERRGDPAAYRIWIDMEFDRHT